MNKKLNSVQEDNAEEIDLGDEFKLHYQKFLKAISGLSKKQVIRVFTAVVGYPFINSPINAGTGEVEQQTYSNAINCKTIFGSMLVEELIKRSVDVNPDKISDKGEKK